MMMSVRHDGSDPSAMDSRLRGYLEEEMGFNLEGVRFDEILQSLDRCHDNFDSFEQFASAVASSIAVHETYFLRHREQFEWIENIWLPLVTARCKPGDSVRIFSGGCATGEEPYSLYAHLAPKLALSGIGLAVDAVDISEPALAKARQGRYGLWSLRGVRLETEIDWLSVQSRTVQVQDWVRRGVTFRQHNLLQSLDMREQYDLILCRNVMIYMHQPAIQRTLANLADVLKKDGVILPGPSDPNPPAGLPLAVHWHEGCRVFAWQDGDGHCPPALPASKASKIPAPVETRIKRAVPLPAQYTDPAVIDTLIRNGHYDSARTLLECNIEQNPMDVRSYITLCLLALDLDDLLLAEQAARKAAYLEPEALFTVYLIGNVKLRQGNHDAAYAEFMWVWQQLRQQDGSTQVKYCEEITVEQFREVVHARIP